MVLLEYKCNKALFLLNAEMSILIFGPQYYYRVGWKLIFTLHRLFTGLMIILQIFFLGALPVGHTVIIKFCKFCTIFQLEKGNPSEFCALNFLLSMPVMLCKCGCGVGGVRGHHYFWLYSCYLSIKDYEIFLREIYLCILCIRQILFLLMLRWFKY